MRTYGIQFVTDYGNIPRGSIMRVCEDFAVFAVANGYAIYCVV
jgi:hypothetical protein